MTLIKGSGTKYRKVGLEDLASKIQDNTLFFSDQLRTEFRPSRIEIETSDFSVLDKRDIKITERLYGLLIDEYPTLNQVAQEFRFKSGERIRQIEMKLLQELYRNITKREWESLYGSNNPNLPVGLTELSTRVKGTFFDKGIKTVKEITNYSRRQLMRFKNFGQKSYDEVSDYLLKFGLKLED